MDKKRLAKYFFKVTPLDFIDVIDLSLLDLEVEKSKNGITVKMPMEIDYEGRQEQLEKDLNSLFLAYSIEFNKAFTLESGGFEKDLPDGRIIHGLVAKDICLGRPILGSPTLHVFSDGVLVVPPEDQKKVLLKNFAKLCNKYYEKDPTAKRIIDLYIGSISKNYTQLSDLFKIRDVLSKIPKKPKEEVWTILGIEKNDWRYVGELSNSTPIFQSRHGMAGNVKLRNITDFELEKIRSIAKKMILGYLIYLDSVQK